VISSNGLDFATGRNKGGRQGWCMAKNAFINLSPDSIATDFY